MSAYNRRAAVRWRAALILLKILYLIAPAIVAGLMLHSIVIRLDLLRSFKIPLDGGRTFRGRPVFGANKTWRGLIVMSLVATLVVLLQKALDSLGLLRSLSMVDYDAASTYALGVALGLGYSLAELPNSFLKRQLGVRPGERSGRWAPIQYAVDQADSPIGATLALVPFVRDVGDLVMIATVGFAVHVLLDELLYVYGAKQRLPQEPGGVDHPRLTAPR